MEPNPPNRPSIAAMQQFSAAVTAWAHNGMPTDSATEATVLRYHPEVRCAVLVEGLSDQAAVTTLALRLDRDFETEKIAVISLDGATNIGKFVELLGPAGFGISMAGLCDAGEQRYFGRALERAYPNRLPDVGLGSMGLDRAGMERLGFFVCEADLEQELITALGVTAVQRVIMEQADLRAWQILQKQPAQQGRSVEQQLRRFMGTTSGRKIHYGSALVNALELDRVPAPLAGLLDFL